MKKQKPLSQLVRTWDNKTLYETILNYEWRMRLAESEGCEEYAHKGIREQLIALKAEQAARKATNR